ncbi:MAG: GNAT family N-acetyltransferase [Chloroflexota bacterium]
MLTSTTAYHHDLGDNLVLKSLANPDDVERLAAFNGIIHGPDVVDMTRALILRHPAARPDYWLYIEDQSTGQIVASLGLIPWEWRYEDVTIKSGEMGIVGTLESYRNRGLIRALDARFKELLREGQFDLSHIQGIPYFYRQFGYEYAIPLEASWQLELQNIPAAPSESPYQFRLATVDDIPVLMRLYDEEVRGLDISTIRDADIWRCIFGHVADSALASEIWMLLDADSQLIGYWRIAQHGFGGGLIVSESSRLSHAGPSRFWHISKLSPWNAKNLISASTCPTTMMCCRWHAAGAHMTPAHMHGKFIWWMSRVCYTSSRPFWNAASPPASSPDSARR